MVVVGACFGVFALGLGVGNFNDASRYNDANGGRVGLIGVTASEYYGKFACRGQGAFGNIGWTTNIGGGPLVVALEGYFLMVCGVALWGAKGGNVSIGVGTGGATTSIGFGFFVFVVCGLCDLVWKFAHCNGFWVFGVFCLLFFCDRTMAIGYGGLGGTIVGKGVGAYGG